MNEKLPPAVSELIDEYKNLKIYDKTVQTPYYRNVKRARGQLRSLVGKGTPSEIIEETMIYSKLRGFNLKESDPTKIREFMRSEGIGVDCSGFVAHLLNTWLKAIKRGSLYSNINIPNLSWYRKFVLRRRTIENISANTMTNENNCIKINLNDVKEGDLLRLKGLTDGHHIAIVTDLLRENGKLKEFTYTHSSEQYGDKNGVKEGKVIITDIKKELKDQKWTELDQNGKCVTLKQLEREYEDNGLRRPKFFTDIK